MLGLDPDARLTLSFVGYELVPLQVDRLSLAFGLVFAIAAFLGGVYALHLREAGQQVAALLYAGSGLGVVFAGDLFTVFVFWEVMAIASAWLIWARRSDISYRAGTRYFFVHLTGGSVLLGGILLHFGETGSLAFTPMQGGVGSWLILAGFLVNAAVPPLHAWLPDAYPRATVTGAVFLSAFTTKTAVYTLIRGFAGWEILVVLGVVMALYGVVYAVLENDIRGILAYHIISQVGYMVAGAGIGTPMAINGATAHAFTHILYKGLLFMGAGAVLHASGRSKLTELGGLARLMPLTLGLYMVGAFSISGFPLFSGFVSKPVTIHAAELSHLGWAALLLHLASVGTFLHTGLKLPYFTWFGPERRMELSPVPKGMLVAMGLAAALNVAIGVLPGSLYAWMPYPVHYDPYTGSHLVKSAQLLLFTFLGFWLLRDRLGGEATIALDTDWFYRRPAGLAYRLAAVQVDRAFGAVERGSLAVARAASRFGTDPWPRGGVSLGTATALLLAWFVGVVVLAILA
jgi:multicomponent Na+:H+ antiporter subunit D